MKTTARNLAILVLVTVTLSVATTWGLLNLTGTFDTNANYYDLRAVDTQNTQSLYTELGLYQNNHLRSMDVQMILFATAEEYGLLYGQEPEDVQANDDGLFPVLINRTSVLAFLTEGSILTQSTVFQSRVFSANNGNVPEALYDRVSVIFTLLPLSGVEENWEQEEVFSGSMRELSTSGRFHIDPDTGVLVLTRPDVRLVVDPSDPIPSLDAEGVHLGETVYFVRSLSGTLVITTGTVAKVIQNTNGTFVFVQAVNAGSDYMTPVFVERDGSLVWIGSIIDGTSGMGVVIPASRIDQIANGVE